MSNFKRIFDYYFNLVCTILLIILITGVCVLIYKDVIKKNDNKIEADDNKISIRDIQEEKEDNIPDTNKELIKVDLKGSVKKPAVYEIEKGKNVSDLINMAGGITKNGTTKNINLSKVLEDQMVVKISNKNDLEKNDNEIISECVCPEIEITKCEENAIIKQDGNNVNAIISEDEIKNETVSDSKINDSKLELISINTATKEELMTLTGIGESKAIAIIEYRNSNGKFQKIEDIKNVSGIGDALFEKIKSNITT